MILLKHPYQRQVKEENATRSESILNPYNHSYYEVIGYCDVALLGHWLRKWTLR